MDAVTPKHRVFSIRKFQLRADLVGPGAKQHVIVPWHFLMQFVSTCGTFSELLKDEDLLV